MLMTFDNLNFIDFKVSSLSSRAPGIFSFTIFSLIYNSFDEIQLVFVFNLTCFQHGWEQFNVILFND